MGVLDTKTLPLSGGGFRIPHDEGGSHQVMSPEIIHPEKCPPLKMNDWEPLKNHTRVNRNTSEPNPPLLSYMLIFQDANSAVSTKHELIPLKPTQKSTSRHILHLSPSVVGLCVAIEKSWFSQKPKKINKNRIINLYVETSSFVESLKILNPHIVTFTQPNHLNPSFIAGPETPSVSKRFQPTQGSNPGIIGYSKGACLINSWCYYWSWT